MYSNIFTIGQICKRFSSGKFIAAEFLSDTGLYPVYGGNGLRGYADTSNFIGECSIIGRQGAKCGNVRYFNGRGYMTDHAIIAITNKDHDNRFLSYKLSLAELGRFSGQAAQPGLSVQKLSRIKLDMPSLSVQRKISSILSAYDSLIENNNKRIRLLEQMAENLYKEWFVRFRFPGHEKVGMENGLPKGWRIEKLEKILEVYDHKRKPLSSLQRMEMNKIYPYYGAAELMDYVDDYLFDGRYLLMGEDGSVITPDGYPMLQIVDGKFWVNNHAHVLQGKKGVTVNFLYLLFKKMNISGVVTGAAQPKISKGRLLNKSIVMPAKEIRVSFEKLINSFFDQIKILTNQNASLTRQRDLLLPRLMSGKLEVM